MDFSTFTCVVVPTVLIIAILVIRAQLRASRARQLQEAYTAYQSALRKLKDRPTDASRRQMALEAGRHYSSLTRESKGTTVFDEVALKNDLDAATAGAVSLAAAVTPAPPIAPPAAPSVADRLRKLDDLKAQGLVTEAEYQERRAKILGEV